jgi:hypothetical protein
MTIDDPQPDVTQGRTRPGENAEEQAAVTAEDQRPTLTVITDAGPQRTRQLVRRGDGLG